MAGNNAHSGELRNLNVRHEQGDVNAHALTKYGLSLAALVVIFMFGLWFMFEYLKHRVDEMSKAQSASAIVNAQKQPPEPRLQPHPQRDLREFRADEDRLIHQYAWLDPDKGVVRIPVARAMDLIAQRGLPATPQQTTGKTK